MTKFVAKFSKIEVTRNSKNNMAFAWLVEAPEFHPKTQTGFAPTREKAERAKMAHIAGLKRFHGKNKKQDVLLGAVEVVETVIG